MKHEDNKNTGIRQQANTIELKISENHTNIIDLAHRIGALKGCYNEDLAHAIKLAQAEEKRLTCEYLDFTLKYKLCF